MTRAASLRCILTVSLIAVSFPVQGLADTESLPPTRTIVADLLMIDGDFYVVRGERGEIRIEATPETTISEEFTFGDRIKAVVLPNDKAISIERAGPDDPVGITVNAPKPSGVPTDKRKPVASHQHEPGPSSHTPAQPSPLSTGQEERIIIADLLMIDGDFYVVRGERGEIRIEATPETTISEEFTFGDRIKAAVLPNDKAIWIKRAKPEEVPGIYTMKPAQPSRTSEEASRRPAPAPASASDKGLEQEVVAPAKTRPSIRTIVAEILMVDGDFYVVRGERGEIRIEITPDTQMTESFDFGDKIKAKVLPNDKAISVERAKPDEPIGVFGP